MGGVGVGEQAPDERKMLKRCRVAHSSESGEAELRLDVPDSITTWVAEAVGLSEGKGLGLAERAELRTFKPFFVDFTLPYSLIRGEQTKVPLTVYNYLPTCAEVSLRAGGGGRWRGAKGPKVLHLRARKADKLRRSWGVSCSGRRDGGPWC